MATENAESPAWDSSGPRQTIEQLSRLVEGKFRHLQTNVRSAGSSFAALPKVNGNVDGILSLHGEVVISGSYTE